MSSGKRNTSAAAKINGELLAAAKAVLMTVQQHAERYPGDREAAAEAAALQRAIEKAEAGQKGTK